MGGSARLGAAMATVEVRRCSVAAVVLWPVKEEPGKENGARDGAGERRRLKRALWLGFATLGRAPATHGQPRVHAVAKV